jgi:hypothetical protein
MYRLMDKDGNEIPVAAAFILKQKRGNRWASTLVTLIEIIVERPSRLSA